MSVVDDVIAYLDAQGVLDGSTGWPSSPRLVHDDSDRLVTIAEDAGPAPELAGGSFDGASKFEGVRVVVRGAPFEGDLAAARAVLIRDALHGLTATALGSTTYEGVWSLTSSPAWIGYDGNSRPEFSLSFRLMSPQPA